MVEVSTMIDTIGTDADSVPIGTPFVGAYVSGLDGVPWDPSEIERLTGSHIIRIYQGAGTYPGVDGYDMLDIEAGALTTASAASEVEKRVQRGYIWTIVYGNDSTLSAVATAIKALGENIWNGHVYSFLADWNLSQAEAEPLLGTEIHGMTCVGVQWASPTSNPKTVAPGTSKTLSALNFDLSVVDASRLPLPGLSALTPPGGGVPQLSGMVVWDTSDAYHSDPVVSSDGGNTWIVQK